jgi:hypothetical protein
MVKKNNNKKISTHRGRITFAWICGLTSIIARKMYMRFVLHLPCLHLRGLSVI